MHERTPDDAGQPDNDPVRAWLRRTMAQLGLKATPFARAAGLAPSTIIRALDPEGGSTLERASIAKIKQAFSVPGPDEAHAGPPGLSEPDLLALSDTESGDLPPSQCRKTINTRALELVGYMPGDIITLDKAVKPVAGDVVEAQIYARGAAETVLRLYDRPYLVSRTLDPTVSGKPALVDDEMVKIAAVVVRCERVRRSP